MNFNLLDAVSQGIQITGLETTGIGLKNWSEGPQSKVGESHLLTEKTRIGLKVF